VAIPATQVRRDVLDLDPPCECLGPLGAGCGEMRTNRPLDGFSLGRAGVARQEGAEQVIIDVERGAHMPSLCHIRVTSSRMVLGGKHSAMPHIRLIDVDEATGELREEYDAAIRRAGKVFNIVKAMSLRPRALRAAMELYKDVMFGPSELSRAERELLAVVVSCANDCHY
jgi:hypothetical protein